MINANFILFLLLGLIQMYVIDGFRSTLSPSWSTTSKTPQWSPSSKFSATGTNDDTSNDGNEQKTERKICFYKPTTTRTGRWLERIHIDDLEIGQKLSGYVVQDLTTGRTGPKVWFEVGVGRTDSKGEWHIVNGMLRLPRSKVSVTRKRLSRLRAKNQVDLFVSRIDRESGRLEVCNNIEDVENNTILQSSSSSKTKISISMIKQNQEVTGTVTKILPYGVMVDIGANRLGLLHIQKVADLYGKYINKEDGLVEAGLEKGAKIRLVVESNEKRRLFLDFTNDVKNIASEEKLEQQKGKEETEKQQQQEETTTKTTTTTTTTTNTQSNDYTSNLSADELAAWAEYATQGDAGDRSKDDNDDDEDEDEEYDYSDYDDYADYDDYDEQRDIEDQLGLGTY